MYLPIAALRWSCTDVTQAASMNTLWDYLDDWDEEHCKNVCEASWVACRLRNCYHLPDVRKQEL